MFRFFAVFIVTILFFGAVPLEADDDDAFVLKGRVVDEHGEPLAGADILVLNSKSYEWVESSERTKATRDDLNALAKGKTGAEGGFEIRGDGYPNVLVISQDSMAPTWFFIEYDEDEFYSLELRTGHSLSGLVEDENGMPLSQAKMLLYPIRQRSVINRWSLSVPASGFFDEKAQKEFESGEEGLCLLPPLPGGSYRVEILFEGQLLSVLPEEIELSQASPDSLAVFRVAPSWEISGRVLDNIGASVEGVTVTVSGESEKNHRVRRKTRTDREGYFQYKMQVEAPITLFLKKEGYADDVSRSLYPKDFPVHATLYPFGGVEGKVIDPAGDPVAELLLRGKWWEENPEENMQEHEGKMVLPPFRRLIKHDFSELAGGRFLYGELVPGFYELVFRSGDFQPWIIKNLEIKPGVVSALGRHRLEAGISLTGSVTDSHGSPVSGAEVKVMKSLYRAQAAEDFSDTSQTGGGYEMTGLSQGKYYVRAEHPDYALGEVVELDVDDEALRSGELSQDFVLFQGATVWGVVLDEEGVPAAKAGVSYPKTPGNLFSRESVTCDANGNFEMTHVPPGEKSFTVSFESHTYEKTVFVEEGQRHEIVFGPEPVTMRGRYLKADGSSFTATLMPEDIQESGLKFIVKRGESYHLSGLTPGLFKGTLWVVAFDARSVSLTTVTLEVPDTHEVVDHDLQMEAEVYGTLVAPQACPEAKNVSVILAPEGTDPAMRNDNVVAQGFADEKTGAFYMLVEHAGRYDVYQNVSDEKIATLTLQKGEVARPVISVDCPEESGD